MYTDPFEDAVSVQEAARLLGVSRPTVYRLLEAGRLTARQHPVTGRKLLSRQEVAALLPADQSAALLTADRVQEGAPAPSMRYVVEPLASAPLSEGAGAVDSIFRLPELGLELPVDDVSERVDYYRFHGMAADATSVPGYVRPDRGERAE